MSDDKLAKEYLRRIEREMSRLPGPRRRELREEIAEHLATARAENPRDPSAVRNAIERLGDPADIAAEARAGLDYQDDPRDWRDTAALALLLVGGIVLPLVGWIVGVVLLWRSSVWSTRDKLLGTLVVPGGLALPLYLELTVTLGSRTCTSSQRSIDAPFVESCTGTGATALQQIGFVGLVIVLTLASAATVVTLARRR